MKYRKFGEKDFKVSALGFGAMRLPVNNNDQSDIDEDEAVKMIRFAIDQGINYIDTAWPYHDGNSEIVVAKALKEGYRDKTKIATKLPVWLVKEEKDMDKYLDKQLSKLELDYIDFYLLHALDADRWKNLKKLNIFEWIEKIKANEKVKNIGFSFHGDYDTFKDIIDSYNWDFCQIQYNYLDNEYQAGKKGLHYAYNQGIAVVVMEPLRGGTLAAEPPAKAKKIIDQSEWNRTTADWALQWLWNQPEVSTVLSGMSTMQQVKENIISANNSKINKLSEEELDIIKSITEEMRGPITCTRCSYCIPCPNDVNIPENFYLYNDANVYDKYQENQTKYHNMNKENRAENCVECGQCEDACPQKLPIMKLLVDVAGYFNH